MRINRKPIVEPKSTITLVSRADWGADKQDGVIPPLKLPATNVFFTYTNTQQCSNSSNTLPPCHSIVKDLQSEAMYQHNLADIPYNFLLGGDGCVYEGRGWKLKPEPIPDEPELNERNTLVVAYIGKKEDDHTSYRKKLLERLESYFNAYCYVQGFVECDGEVTYAKSTPEVMSAALVGKDRGGSEAGDNDGGFKVYDNDDDDDDDDDEGDRSVRDDGHVRLAF